MIRVFRTGLHAHRMPLSYPALWPLFERQIRIVDRPDEADLYLFAHVMDIQAAPRALVEDWRRRRRPVVLLSEEPFWDTIWGGHPLDPLIHVDTDFGALPVHQLNHHTAREIYRFTHLPYFLLTNHRFANAYASRFARNAACSAADWTTSMAARQLRTVFMFERRPEPYHAVQWPQGGIIGLCSWRTELAHACDAAGVLRLGQSWQGGRSRFELATDWHLDKLVRLDRRSRMIGALENTHQPDYITEKLFDAFACGAVPVYYAAPDHRIHDLGLPPEAWINLYGLSPQTAAEKLAALPACPVSAEAFEAAQRGLARHFGDSRIWIEERDRLARAVLAALEGVLAGAS